MTETPLTRFLATQTLAQLREMKAEVRNEIESAQGRVAELEADLSRIEQAMSEKAGGRLRPGDITVTDRAPEVRRSLKVAIVEVMRTRPDSTWSTQDVLDALLMRAEAPGGKKPLNTVGSRMIEMASEGTIYKAERGIYSMTPRQRLILAPEREEVPSV